VFGEDAGVAGIGVSAAFAFLIITLLHVVVGELAPKSVAISRTRPTAVLVAPWMRAFYLMTKPAVDLFNGNGQSAAHAVRDPTGPARPVIPRIPRTSCARCCARARSRA